MLRYIISFYLFLAVLTTSFFTTYILIKSRYTYMKVFAGLGLCVNLYLFGYLMEINSSLLEQMKFWNQIQYLGLPFFPALWVIIALFYRNKTIIFTDRKQIILLIVPALTFIIRLTNSYHHLYYQSMVLQQTTGFPVMHLEKGIWYYINTFYLFICMIISSVVFYIEYRKGKKSENKHFRILFFASIIPYMGLISDLLRGNIDYTALLLPISMVLVMYAIYMYDFLDIKTLAREALFEKSSDGMILLDNDLKIIDYNKTANEFFPVLRSSMQKIALEDIFRGQEDLIHVFQNTKTQDFLFKHNGQERFFEISTSVMKNAYGKPIGTLKSLRDITEKKKMQEKLKKIAVMDELSGLNNRRHFMEIAQREFERCQAQHQSFAVLMIDVDHFKFINDTRGHAGGDAVIRKFGNLMKLSFRETDILGRLGGEEFSVILPNTSIGEAYIMAENFRETIEGSEVYYEDAPIYITVSIGIALFFSEAKNFDAILKYADEAMYNSKTQGRNRTTLKVKPN